MKYQLLVLILLLQGCSTTWTQLAGHNAIDENNYNQHCDPVDGMSPIYSGTKLNSMCIYDNVDGVAFFCIIDFPLSLVADTAILPYTIFTNLSGIGYCSELPPNKNRQSDAKNARLL